MAGSSSEARMAMMAITTKSSIMVNFTDLYMMFFPVFLASVPENMGFIGGGIVQPPDYPE